MPCFFGGGGGSLEKPRKITMGWGGVEMAKKDYVVFVPSLIVKDTGTTFPPPGLLRLRRGDGIPDDGWVAVHFAVIFVLSNPRKCVSMIRADGNIAWSIEILPRARNSLSFFCHCFLLLLPLLVV